MAPARKASTPAAATLAVEGYGPEPLPYLMTTAGDASVAEEVFSIRTTRA